MIMDWRDLFSFLLQNGQQGRSAKKKRIAAPSENHMAADIAGLNWSPVAVVGLQPSGHHDVDSDRRRTPQLSVIDPVSLRTFVLHHMPAGCHFTATLFRRADSPTRWSSKADDADDEDDDDPQCQGGVVVVPATWDATQRVFEPALVTLDGVSALCRFSFPPPRASARADVVHVVSVVPTNPCSHPENVTTGAVAATDDDPLRQREAANAGGASVVIRSTAAVTVNEIGGWCQGDASSLSRMLRNRALPPRSAASSSSHVDPRSHFRTSAPRSSGEAVPCPTAAAGQDRCVSFVDEDEDDDDANLDSSDVTTPALSGRGIPLSSPDSPSSSARLAAHLPRPFNRKGGKSASSRLPTTSKHTDGVSIAAPASVASCDDVASLDGRDAPPSSSSCGVDSRSATEHAVENEDGGPILQLPPDDGDDDDDAAPGDDADDARGDASGGREGDESDAAMSREVSSVAGVAATPAIADESRSNPTAVIRHDLAVAARKSELLDPTRHVVVWVEGQPTRNIDEFESSLKRVGLHTILFRKGTDALEYFKAHHRMVAAVVTTALRQEFESGTGISGLELLRITRGETLAKDDTLGCHEDSHGAIAAGRSVGQGQLPLTREEAAGPATGMSSRAASSAWSMLDGASNPGSFGPGREAAELGGPPQSKPHHSDPNSAVSGGTPPSSPPPSSSSPLFILHTNTVQVADGCECSDIFIRIVDGDMRRRVAVREVVRAAVRPIVMWLKKQNRRIKPEWRQRLEALGLCVRVFSDSSVAWKFLTENSHRVAAFITSSFRSTELRGHLNALEMARRIQQITNKKSPLTSVVEGNIGGLTPSNSSADFAGSDFTAGPLATTGSVSSLSSMLVILCSRAFTEEEVDGLFDYHTLHIEEEMEQMEGVVAFIERRLRPPPSSSHFSSFAHLKSTSQRHGAPTDLTTASLVSSSSVATAHSVERCASSGCSKMSGAVIFGKSALVPLSNSYRAAMQVDGKEYPDMEHFYQSAKHVLEHPLLAEEIRLAPSIHKAFELAMGTKINTGAWNHIRDHVMLYGFGQKFSNPAIAATLLATAGKRIILHHPDDDYWGDGGQAGTGRNRHGELLMQVRGKLQHIIDQDKGDAKGSQRLATVFANPWTRPPPPRGSLSLVSSRRSLVGHHGVGTKSENERPHHHHPRPARERGGGAMAAPSANSLVQKSVFTVDYNDRIGSGGSGIVYKAVDNLLGGVVACKEARSRMSSAHVDDESMSASASAEIAAEYAKLCQQWQKEFSLMLTLVDPYIVQVLHAEFQDNVARIFMEWMPNGSLEDKVRKDGRLYEAAICRYTQFALEGLQYLHEHDVVHGDIKPANMLLNGKELKLSDFGLSAVVVATNASNAAVAGTEGGGGGGTEDATAEPLVSQEAQCFAGTPRYMSAARFKTMQISKADDVWAIGMSIIRLAQSHTQPYEGLSNLQICRAVCAHELPEIPSTLSPTAVSFIHRCLTIEPSERPSVEALLRDKWFVHALDEIPDMEPLANFEAEQQKLRQQQDEHRRQQQRDRGASHPSSSSRMHRGSSGRKKAPLLPVIDDAPPRSQSHGENAAAPMESVANGEWSSPRRPPRPANVSTDGEPHGSLSTRAASCNRTPSRLLDISADHAADVGARRFSLDVAVDADDIAVDDAATATAPLPVRIISGGGTTVADTSDDDGDTSTSTTATTTAMNRAASSGWTSGVSVDLNEMQQAACKGLETN